jgi:hypothetical protein
MSVGKSPGRPTAQRCSRRTHSSSVIGCSVTEPRLLSPTRRGVPPSAARPPCMPRRPRGPRRPAAPPCRPRRRRSRPGAVRRRRAGRAARRRACACPRRSFRLADGGPAGPLASGGSAASALCGGPPGRRGGLLGAPPPHPSVLPRLATPGQAWPLLASRSLGSWPSPVGRGRQWLEFGCRRGGRGCRVRSC